MEAASDQNARFLVEVVCGREVGVEDFASALLLFFCLLLAGAISCRRCFVGIDLNRAYDSPTHENG